MKTFITSLFVFLLISTSLLAETESSCYKVGATINFGFIIGGAATGDIAFCKSEDGKYWVEIKAGGATQNQLYNAKNEHKDDDNQVITSLTFDVGKRMRQDNSGVFFDKSVSRIQRGAAMISFGEEAAPEASLFENWVDDETTGWKIDNLSLGIGLGASDIKISNIHIKVSPSDWYYAVGRILMPDIK